ncbi:MAG: hypothetical protein M3Q33_01020 [Acidobacteriota bacterium]|nr:hypothetical protein [Acidobacteriota bacterium]
MCILPLILFPYRHLRPNLQICRHQNPNLQPISRIHNIKIATALRWMMSSTGFHNSFLNCLANLNNRKTVV